MSYIAKIVKAPTPQSEPLAGTTQVRNSASGYAFPVDDWTRLDRFLILGSEGGSYYATARKLTMENAQAVLRCIAADGVRTVNRIAEISDAGRAPKNDPAIFALALAAAHGDAGTRKAALAALPVVCRIGTHLFHFAELVDGLRGWGRGLRSAVASWYNARPARDLAYGVVKYQQRDGWSQRDLLRLSHPVPASDQHKAIYWWITRGWDWVGDEPHPDPALLPLWAFERVKRATTAAEVARLVRDYRVPREAVPTRWLTEPAVWDALLEEMPIGALIRNLATLTRVGLLAPNAATRRVVAQLGDAVRLRKARVHPVAVLAALKTYASGKGERGKHTWTPVTQVTDALDGAFYAAFGATPSTGLRWLLALDVSGSMDGGAVAGVPGLTPRVASAAMALVTAATEPQHTIVGFTSSSDAGVYGSNWQQHTALTRLDIGPRVRLETAVQKVSDLPFGGTDCALPMLWAAKQRVQVDVFVVYTDSETWAGDIHPVEALRRYREQTGIPAKLVVVGMVSNGFSIADPEDGGMLDMVGFDTATPDLIAGFARGFGPGEAAARSHAPNA